MSYEDQSHRFVITGQDPEGHPRTINQHDQPPPGTTTCDDIPARVELIGTVVTVGTLHAADCGMCSRRLR